MCFLIMYVPSFRDSASSTIDMTPEERKEQQKREEALHASSLRIPRRYDLFCHLNLFCCPLIVSGLMQKMSYPGHHEMLKCMQTRMSLP